MRVYILAQRFKLELTDQISQLLRKKFNQFASRLLIDTLYAHGFCISYSEVQKFIKCAAISHGTNIPDYFLQAIQFAADNVDHNICTLDGFGTFHGMGMIAIVTPEVNALLKI